MLGTLRNIQEKTVAEENFIFAQNIENVSLIRDNEGQALKFSTSKRGNHVVFTKDNEGTDVAVEHCVDGTKVFHLKEDTKGLPAMHEFKTDGTEFMYLYDLDCKLEKSIEKKTNGDKLSTWFGPNNEIISEEQRQKGGIVFRMMNEEAEALIWLKADGAIIKNGDEGLVSHLKKVFKCYLDGADV